MSAVNEFAECIPLLHKGINILAESREGGSAISSLESPIWNIYSRIFYSLKRSLLLKIALENFLYIFQIGDSKLRIANPPSLDSASMLMPSQRRGTPFPAIHSHLHGPPLQQTFLISLRVLFQERDRLCP